MGRKGERPTKIFLVFDLDFDLDFDLIGFEFKPK